jgi:hypothetical protein
MWTKTFCVRHLITKTFIEMAQGHISLSMVCEQVSHVVNSDFAGTLGSLLCCMLDMFTRCLLHFSCLKDLVQWYYFSYPRALLTPLQRCWDLCIPASADTLHSYQVCSIQSIECQSWRRSQFLTSLWLGQFSGFLTHVSHVLWSPSINETHKACFFNPTSDWWLEQKYVATDRRHGQPHSTSCRPRPVSYEHYGHGRLLILPLLFDWALPLGRLEIELTGSVVPSSSMTLSSGLHESIMYVPRYTVVWGVCWCHRLGMCASWWSNQWQLAGVECGWIMVGFLWMSRNWGTYLHVSLRKENSSKGTYWICLCAGSFLQNVRVRARAPRPRARFARCWAG